MVRHEHWFVRVFLASVLLASVVFPVAARSKFTTIDVPRAISTEARGINDRGEIVGIYQRPDGLTHGFLLADGVYKSIDVPFASFTEAHGINVRGEIVGIYEDGHGRHGFLFTAGHFTAIDQLQTLNPQGINARGEIVGFFPSGVGTPLGFFIDSQGLRTFGRGSPTTATQAYGVNARGEIVGTFSEQGVGDYGFVLNQRDALPDTPVDAFATLFRVPGTGSAPPTGIPTSATGINDRTEIVGTYTPTRSKGFFLDSHGTFVFLDVPGATSTQPNGINNLDEIVGSYTAHGTTHGFLFADMVSDDDCHDRHENGDGHDQHEKEHGSNRHCDHH